LSRGNVEDYYIKDAGAYRRRAIIALTERLERVKRSVGAGDALLTAKIPVEFHATRNRSSFTLAEMLDALLDVFHPTSSVRCGQVQCSQGSTMRVMRLAAREALPVLRLPPVEGGVVGEGRVDGAVDRRDGMGQRRSGERIGVGTDVGLLPMVTYFSRQPPPLSTS
jgi:hypothetical protein